MVLLIFSVGECHLAYGELFFYMQENHNTGYNKTAFLKETCVEKVDTYVFRTIAIFDYIMI